MASTASARAATDPVEGVKRAWKVLGISIGVTLLLYVVPYGDVIGRPLLYLSTLVHELGHGITAIFVGGDFQKLEMWSDGSGVAWSSASSNGQHALITMGGLVGPAFAAAGGFVLARRRSWARWGLVAVALVLLWACLFKIRTGFGFVVAGAVIAACGAVALKATDDWAQLLLGFLSVQLALAVFSRGDYLFMEEAHTGNGVGLSDSAAIGKLIGGPYWFWGGLCGLISILALAFGAWAMLRGVRKRGT